jgi:DNA-binding response OmpR family regulator
MPDNKIGAKVLKVLIADDEPDVLAIAAKKIRESGFDVVSAADGVEAWEKILSESPDVIVLDLNMPRKDGFSVLKDLRTTPPDARWRPVIILSARTEMDSFRKGFSLDADHYLSKPCSMEELVGAVRLMASLIPMRA